MWMLENNLHPLQEQQVLWISETSLQSLLDNHIINKPTFDHLLFLEMSKHVWIMLWIIPVKFSSI